jgi:integrase
MLTKTNNNADENMKTNYILSTKVDSRGKAQILLRFVATRTEIYRGKTNIWIKPANWDGRLNEPRPSRRDQEDISECRRVQLALDALSTIVIEKYTEDSGHGKDWLKNTLSEVRFGADGMPLNASKSEFAMLGMGESYKLMVDTDSDNNVLAPSTTNTYRAVQKKIERYEREVGKVRVRDFDGERFDSIFLWIRQNYRLSDNTMADMRTKILRWWHWCQDHDGTLPTLPSKAGRTKGKAYGTPYYLTKEQRDKLYYAEMPDYHTALARDFFVFQSLIGCRWSDMLTFTKANIQGDCLVYIAVKTLRSNPQTISVPLHPIAREIIDRYKWCKTLIPNPKHHETFNARLRRAIKVAGIDCRITIRDCHTGQPRQVMLSEVASSHMARRTFIGCLYEQGFSESDICSMSGHKEGSISIQRYRRVSDERKRKMIDSI